MKMRLKSVLLSSFLIILGVTHDKQAFACGSAESFIGSMCVFAGNFAPRGYAFAEGQLLDISTHTALFSILGTTYGGDGRTTFALPDMRGRTVIGSNQGPGLSNYRNGATGGEESVTLSVNQIPGHSHSAVSNVTATATAKASLAGDTDNGSDAVWGQNPRDDIYSSETPELTMSSDAIEVNVSVETTIGSTGGNRSHENRMPYIAMHWIIALEGVYPARN